MGEIEATRRTAGLFDFSDAGKIALTGADRVSFLHGMVTSDIAGLAEGAAQPSAIVDAAGKVVANLVIVRRREEILLESAPERRGAVIATLGKFLVADDVELSDRTSDWAILSVQGPLAGHILGHACAGLDPLPATPYALVEIDQPEGLVLVVRHDRFGPPGYDVWAPSGGAAALRERLVACGAEHGLASCGAETREALRVLAGRPAWGREIDDLSFPHEVGLASVVSSAKGCYVGQEVLARIHFLGHVNRVLARVSLDRAPGPDEPLPIPLSLDGADAGRLTSVACDPEAARPAGLAVLRRAVAAPGAQYEARPAMDPPFGVTVVALVS